MRYLQRDSADVDEIDPPQGLTPISIFQALSATHSDAGDPVKIDSKSTYLISIVGVLKHVVQDGAQLNYIFEDHTGQISGYHIITPHGPTEYKEMGTAPVSWLNAYVKVIGCLQQTTSTRTIAVHQVDVSSICRLMKQPAARMDEYNVRILKARHHVLLSIG
eukprot:m.1184514 g.1184514  ORF g.1184514 m.1184514 type:complete len:162 (+) comp24541_c0_seq41:351-836(+)